MWCCFDASTRLETRGFGGFRNRDNERSFVHRGIQILCILVFLLLQLQVGCIEAGGIAEWVGWIEGDDATEWIAWIEGEGMAEWVDWIEGGDTTEWIVWTEGDDMAEWVGWAENGALADCRF